MIILNIFVLYKYFFSNRRLVFIFFCLSFWRRFFSDIVDKFIVLEGLFLIGDVGRDELFCVEVFDLEEIIDFFDFIVVGNILEKVW